LRSKTFKFVTTGLLVSTVLATLACGIPQEEFAKVELAAALVEQKLVRAESTITSLKNNLSTERQGNVDAQVSIANLRSNLSASERDQGSLKEELFKTHNQNKELTSSLAEIEDKLQQTVERIQVTTYHTHIDDVNGFSFQYPSNWTRFSAGESPDIGLLALYTSPGNVPNVLVMLENVAHPVGVDAYFGGFKDSLLPHNSVSLNRTTINGMDALIYAYTYIKTPEVLQMIALLVRGQSAWGILFTSHSETFLEWTHPFLEIAHSFDLS
jgi:hypothetical protein